MKLVLLMCLVSMESMASEKVLLKLRRVRPYIACDVSLQSVEITRINYGIKFSKKVPYKIDDFSNLIEEAYKSQNTSNLSSEHFAFYPVQGENEYFNLSQSDTKSLKLINLISMLCELKPL